MQVLRHGLGFLRNVLGPYRVWQCGPIICARHTSTKCNGDRYENDPILSTVQAA